MRTHTAAPPTGGLDALCDLLHGRTAVALVGAGCSTESGIPDYRGPDGRMRARTPMQYGEFVRSVESRTRYWARSAVGWRRIARAEPNGAHRALARLEEVGAVCGVITQNVDGLHHAAGSRRVVELHGTLSRVCCLDCGARYDRRAFQERLTALNRGWLDDADERAREGRLRSAPDGDADVAQEHVAGFTVPPCNACGGVLKPDVVFFGESVPAERVRAAWRLFEDAEVLLVLGSSLTVYSGRRFVYRAESEGVPIGVVNRGPTRADELAAVKVDGRLGRILPEVATRLA